jgi:hypothetical protein
MIYVRMVGDYTFDFVYIIENDDFLLQMGDKRFGVLCRTPERLVAY